MGYLGAQEPVQGGSCKAGRGSRKMAEVAQAFTASPPTARPRQEGPRAPATGHPAGCSGCFKNSFSHQEPEAQVKGFKYPPATSPAPSTVTKHDKVPGQKPRPRSPPERTGPGSDQIGSEQTRRIGSGGVLTREPRGVRRIKQLVRCGARLIISNLDLCSQQEFPSGHQAAPAPRRHPEVEWERR